ncbi:jerky protein homolog-like isoform X1 [Dreissena polymorpha]|uniref:jerky protein homolog-like isoform X1 n=2 Tax=Dreissena polymorpha TaxID=45954 RepID=UPI0022646F7E|nr:jerky protein homolog-like isoform X1 [Dreissena polymorpha]
MIKNVVLFNIIIAITIAFHIWLSAMARKRGKILQYDHYDLEQALNAVKAGESIRNAALKFNVPKSTLGDRISGRFDVIKPRHGRPPAIPVEIEEKIVKSVKMAAKLGVGLSRKSILLRTNVLCRRIKLETSYTNFKAGKDWWEGVKRRHPELSIRKPEKLSAVRARMLNPVVVNNYFEDLNQIVNGMQIGPAQVWNCDETGLNFEHSPVRVVAERGAAVVSKTSQKSSNLTIMACVNAAGKAMPPLIITKGKTVRSLHGFNTTDAPSNAVWSFQENGWINDEIGEKWFNTVFLKHCGPQRPQLLIFDGHSSQVNAVNCMSIHRMFLF